MLAIGDFHPDPNEHKDGLTYAWGRNSRGQLGIGNHEDQNEPVKIQFAKEMFKKVVCGQNFSMGLTANGSVYFWGNYKYFCEKVNKDFLEPTILKSLEGKWIKDIACCQYYCLVLNDKGEILQWGKYLKEKVKSKKEGIKGAEVKTMIKFPNINKFDVLMETISTGPNHSASVSVKKGIYSWGNGEGGRLGLQHDEMKKAKVEPLLVAHIMELLQQNR